MGFSVPVGRPLSLLLVSLPCIPKSSATINLPSIIIPNSTSEKSASTPLEPPIVPPGARSNPEFAVRTEGVGAEVDRPPVAPLPSRNLREGPIAEAVSQLRQALPRPC